TTRRSKLQSKSTEELPAWLVDWCGNYLDNKRQCGSCLWLVQTWWRACLSQLRAPLDDLLGIECSPVLRTRSFLPKLDKLPTRPVLKYLWNLSLGLLNRKLRCETFLSQRPPNPNHSINEAARYHHDARGLNHHQLLHCPPLCFHHPRESRFLCLYQEKPSQKLSEAHEKTFNMYMNSLNKRDEEPTLDDFDALRPHLSTVRAAVEGVIGSGRALLPSKHPLYLAIEQLGAQETSVGGGPTAKKTVVAGSRKAKRLEYQALYAATEGMITRGFNVAQLKRFEKETKMQKLNEKAKLPPEKTTSKPRIIHSLMNLRWGMMHPTTLKKLMADENESIERSYYVSPSELFIFLGGDGEDLIHLANELKMRISVDWQSLDPLVDPKEQPGRSTTRPGITIRASGAQSSPSIHEAEGTYRESTRYDDCQGSYITYRPSTFLFPVAEYIPDCGCICGQRRPKVCVASRW
ncbi:hypothetical protein RSAG8_08963, partial [Rhizoctonia solani AG-8 WAC10335]